MLTRFIQSVFIGLFVYWIISLLDYSPVFAQSPVPFIAIGDSITAGSQGPSYLCALKDKLGGTVVFSGPYTTRCPDGTVNHAAVDGKFTRDFIDPGNQSIMSIPTSGNAIVLIMLGTNDVYHKIPTETTKNNLAQIIRLIKERNPKTTIFLSGIIPNEANNTGVNSAIASLAQPGVTILTPGTGLGVQKDLKDGVHPNESGAQKIADNLFPAIQPAATALANQPQPTNTPDRLTNQQSSGTQPPIVPQQNAPQSGYNTGMAVGLTLPGGITINGPAGLKFATIADVLNRAVPFVFAFAGIGLLLILLSAGFEFLTSAGDAKKLETAQQRLTYAVVGFLIIFTAYWLVQIAARIFGLTEVQTIFK